jgi:hypothetical protein
MFQKDKSESGRFQLDGDVEARRQSEYIQKAYEETNKKVKIWQVVSAALGLLLVLLAIWFVLKKQEDDKQLESLLVQLSGLDDITKERNQLIEKIDSLNMEIISIQSNNEILEENSGQLDGIFFEVQLGSFSDFDLDNYLEQLAELRQEKYDGKTKLLLGRFRSFKKALLFENDLKKLGLDEVFIVGRIDGNLVTYKEALEELQKRK